MSATPDTEFVAHVKEVDNLFQCTRNAAADSTPFLIACEATVTPAFKLTVIEVAERQRVHELEVVYHDAKRQCDDAFGSVNGLSWRDYFYRIKRAFHEAQISVVNGGAGVRLTTFYNERPVVLKFDLLRVDGEAAQVRINAMLLQAVDCITTKLYKADVELHKLRRMNLASHSPALSPSSTPLPPSAPMHIPTLPYEPSTTASSPPPLPRKNAPKRRAGYSVVTPSAKYGCGLV